MSADEPNNALLTRRLVADEQARERERELIHDFDIPEGAETVALRDLLFFTIGGFSFCMPLVDITTVANIEDVLIDRGHSQELPALCRGFIRYRRQEVPLLDLRPKLGQEPARTIAPGAEGLLIDYGVTYLGLLVDYVFNIEGTSLGYVLPLAGNLTNLGPDFLHDYVVYPGGGAFRLGAQTMFDENDLEALSDVL
jgi:chemotaxis signal transduction protein